MDKDSPPGPPRIVGFHTYADDTLRPLDPHHAGRPLRPNHDELDDEADAPWEQDSFAPATAPIGEPRRQRGLVATLFIVSVAVLAGIATFRMAADRRPSRTPAPVTARSPNFSMQIAQAPSATAPDASTAPPQALSLGMLHPSASPQEFDPPNGHPSRAVPPTSATPPPSAAVDPRGAAPPPPSAPTLTPQVDAAPDTAQHQPPPPVAPVPQTSEPAERSANRARLPGPLDCGRPASPGEQLICSDAELLAADRRMAQAYASADAAGVPPRILQTEQVNWLNAREAASHRSRDAVDRLYRQRIRDLESEASRPR